MTDVNVQRLFPAKQCLFPVVTDSTISKLAARHDLSDAQFGQQLRSMLAPVHFTCVPDKDLRANPPRYTNFDPIQRLSLDGDSYIRAKDLSRDDFANMSDAKVAYKQFLRHCKRSLPYDWWDMPRYTYKIEQHIDVVVITDEMIYYCSPCLELDKKGWYQWTYIKVSSFTRVLSHCITVWSMADIRRTFTRLDCTFYLVIQVACQTTSWIWSASLVPI